MRQYYILRSKMGHRQRVKHLEAKESIRKEKKPLLTKQICLRICIYQASKNLMLARIDIVSIERKDEIAAIKLELVLFQIIRMRLDSWTGIC